MELEAQSERGAMHDAALRRRGSLDKPIRNPPPTIWNRGIAMPVSSIQIPPRLFLGRYLTTEASASVLMLKNLTHHKSKRGICFFRHALAEPSPSCNFPAQALLGPLGRGSAFPLGLPTPPPALLWQRLACHRNHSRLWPRMNHKPVASDCPC